MIDTLRTLTIFGELSEIDEYHNILDESTAYFSEMGEISVRTKRISLLIDNSDQVARLCEQKLENIWYCLSLNQNTSLYNQIIEKFSDVSEEDNLFFNFNFKDCLEVEKIKRIVDFLYITQQKSKNNNIPNFRTGVAFNCLPDAPFFPFSTPSRGGRGFAIGLELVDFFLKRIKGNSRSSLTKLKSVLINDLIKEAVMIENMAKLLEKKLNIPFLGIDLSIAPYPYPLENQSVVEILNCLGSIGRARSARPYKFGDAGTLFFNTFLTDILKEAAKNIRSVGFNGVMYSMLEDEKLCDSFTEGSCNIDTMMMLASTCGIGLDMIPIGKRSKEEVYGLALDIFSLSQVLQKPLGLRIILCDNKPDEETNFIHEYFSNTKVAGTGRGPGFWGLPIKNRDRTIKFIRGAND